jgi:hypothetical protein
MPYAAVGPVPRAIRLAEAGGRWAALERRVPELAPAVALQRELVGIMLDSLDALERGGVPRLSLPPRYLAAKLERGVPALIGERVPVPVAVLGSALLSICRALAAGGAGRAADHLRELLEEGSLDGESLLSASLARNRQTVLKGSVHRGLSPDLVWLVAELAVSPFAHLLQQRILAPGTDARLDAACDRWTHGHCPACGSWPALAETVAGVAILRCSFCAAGWSLPAGTCVYCSTPRTPILHTGLPAGVDDAGRRLETCRTCGGYLKAVDAPALSPFPLVAIADLETADLDAAAMAEGFSRPDLRDFTPSRA